MRTEARKPPCGLSPACGCVWVAGSLNDMNITSEIVKKEELEIISSLFQ